MKRLWEISRLNAPHSVKRMGEMTLQALIVAKNMDKYSMPTFLALTYVR
jgi:hypothetical protein